MKKKRYALIVESTILLGKNDETVKKIVGIYDYPEEAVKIAKQKGYVDYYVEEKTKGLQIGDIV